MAGFGPPYGGPPPPAFGAPPYPYGAAPPPADPLYPFFAAVAGPDLTISAEDLQRCLTDAGMSSYPHRGGSFMLETCRLMISMLDRRGSGTMGFPEFKELWGVLDMWKATFQRYDADRSGSIDGRELAGCIRSFGYQLADTTIAVIVRRYSKSSNGHVMFDEFVALCLRIRILTDQFRRRDTTGQGYASFYFDDFMAVAMSS